MTASNPRKELVRAVGLPGLTAISINGVIGAGIFVLPATVAGILGPASPIAYITAGLAGLLIALCFAEAGGIFDRAGGPYVYSLEAFGPFVAFEVGWMFLLARMTGAAAVANGFAAYLGYVHPLFATPVGRALAISVSITAIGALNYAGVRYGSWVVNVLTVGKLLPLGFFIVVGLFFVDPHAFTLTNLPPLDDLRKATLILFYAIGGFEFASVPTEEVINSRRNLPIALIAGLSISALLYLLIQIVCVGTLPSLASASTPLASAAGVFLGPAGAALMTVAAVLSTTGTNSTILLVGPRMLYALAQGGQLPKVFARVHPRFRTPHISVVVFAAATMLVALSGTFAQLAALNAIARLLYSICTCAAVPVLRKRYDAGQRAFTLPGGWLIPALGVAASLLLLTGIDRTQTLIGGGAILVGVLIYLAGARR